jgi:hypothetical protein
LIQRIILFTLSYTIDIFHSNTYLQQCLNTLSLDIMITVERVKTRTCLSQDVLKPGRRLVPQNICPNPFAERVFVSVRFRFVYFSCLMVDWSPFFRWRQQGNYSLKKKSNNIKSNFKNKVNL